MCVCIYSTEKLINLANSCHKGCNYHTGTSKNFVAPLEIINKVLLSFNKTVVSVTAHYYFCR